MEMARGESFCQPQKKTPDPFPSVLSVTFSSSLPLAAPYARRCRLTKHDATCSSVADLATRLGISQSTTMNNAD